MKVLSTTNVLNSKQQEFIDTAALAIEIKKAELQIELSQPMCVIQVFIRQLPQALTTVINDPDETAPKVIAAQIFTEALQQIVAEDFEVTLSLPKKQRQLTALKKRLTVQEVDSCMNAKDLVHKLMNAYNTKKQGV